MTESMPPTLTQLQQLNRGLTEKVLDRACSDPQWRQQLIEDPELALREANFPELQQLRQAQGSEVQGQDFQFSSSRGGGDIDIEIEGGGFGGSFGGGRWNCHWWTYYWG